MNKQYLLGWVTVLKINLPVPGGILIKAATGKALSHTQMVRPTFYFVVSHYATLKIVPLKLGIHGHFFFFNQ